MADEKQMELGVVFSAQISNALDQSIAKLLSRLSDIEIKLKTGVSTAFTKMGVSATSAMGPLNREIQYVNSTLNRVTGQASATGNAMDTLAGKVVKATGKMNQMNNIAGGLTTKINQMTQAGKQTGSMSKGLEGFIEFTGRFFAVWRIYWAVLNVLKEVTSQASDFAKEMGEVQGVTATSSREMEGLKSIAGEIGSTMLMSLSDVAKGMRVLAQAGLSAKEVQESVKDVAILAQATGASFDETAKLSTTIMKVWEMQASEMSHISDVMASSVNYAKLELSDLNTIFNYLAPSAKMAGYSLEQTAAAAAVLSNAGIKASTIGTGLSTFMSDVLKGSEGLRKSLAQSGLSIEDFKNGANGLLPIPVILRKLSNAGYDLSNMFQGLEKRSARALAAMAQQGDDAFIRMEKRISSTGAALRMYEAAMSPPLVKLKVFYNEMITKGAKAFEEFSKYLLYGIDILKSLEGAVIGVSIVLIGKMIPALTASLIPAFYKFIEVLMALVWTLDTVKISSIIAGMSLKAAFGWIGAIVGILWTVIELWGNWGKTADETNAKFAEQQSLLIRVTNELEELSMAAKGGVLSEEELKKKSIEISKIMNELNLSESLSVEDIRTDGIDKLIERLDLARIKASATGPLIQTAFKNIENGLANIEKMEKERKSIKKPMSILDDLLDQGNAKRYFEDLTKKIEEQKTSLEKDSKVVNVFAQELAGAGVSTDNLISFMNALGVSVPKEVMELLRKELERIKAVSDSLASKTNTGVAPRGLNQAEKDAKATQLALMGVQHQYDLMNSQKYKDYGALKKQREEVFRAELAQLNSKKDLEDKITAPNDQATKDAEHLIAVEQLRLKYLKDEFDLNESSTENGRQINELLRERLTLEGDSKIEQATINNYVQALKDKEIFLTAEYRKQKAIMNQLQGKTDLQSVEDYNKALQTANGLQKDLKANIVDQAKKGIEYNQTVLAKESEMNAENLRLSEMQAGVNQETAASHDAIIAQKKKLIDAQLAYNDAQIQAELDAQKLLAEKGQVGTSAYTDSINKLQDLKVKNAELVGSAKELKTEWQVAGQQIGTSLANNVGTVFTDILEGSKSVGEAFGDMAKSIIADILKIITKMLVMKAIQSSMGDTAFGSFLGLDKLSIAGAAMGGRASQKFRSFASGGRVKDNLIGRFNSQEGIISGQGMKMLGNKFDAINRGDNLFPNRKPNSGSGGKEQQSQLPFGNTQHFYQISAVDAPSLVRLLSTPSSQEAIGNAIQNKMKHNSPIRQTVKKGR